MTKFSNQKQYTIVFLLFIIIIFSACKKNDTNIVNTWKLVEQYSDPGDGSGEFNPVDSERFIQFNEDGTVVSNGSFCSMSIEANGASTAVYNDSIISVLDCDFDNFNIYYEIQNDNLILWYPCIEGCAQKYILTE